MFVKLVNFMLSCNKNNFSKIMLLGFLSFFSVTAPAQERLNTSKDSVAITKVVLGIASYSRWPQALERLNICIVGMTQYADDLQGNTDLENVDVARIAPSDTDRLQACHVLYIGQLNLTEKESLYNKIIGMPILSISEENKLCDDGALICLRVSDGSAGFQINTDAVARSGLRIQPRVLKLGR